MPCMPVPSDRVALGPVTGDQGGSGVWGRLAQSGGIWGRWYLVWHWFCRTARRGGAALAIPITDDMMILWRMPGEVPASGHVAPGRDCMGAVCGTARRLRAVPDADLHPASAASLAASWQSAFCRCGFWRKPPFRRWIMSRSRPVSAPLRRRDRPHAPVEIRSISGSHGG
jgi:hypothetical protein